MFTMAFVSIGRDPPRTTANRAIGLGRTEVSQYKTDVVLNSTRAMGVAELRRQPTFAELPAARAGQIFPWNSQNMDYVAQAHNMDALAGWLEQSGKVT